MDGGSLQIKKLVAEVGKDFVGPEETNFWNRINVLENRCTKHISVQGDYIEDILILNDVSYIENLILRTFQIIIIYKQQLKKEGSKIWISQKYD